MAQIQIILFFAVGFLVSRVMIKARLPQKLVRLLMGHSHNSMSFTLLYLLSTAAIVSIFIPNSITMLALLPVLDLLSRAFRKDCDSKVPTMLTLAVLYGANIGGIGAITGTPTNLVLIGYLKANHVPGVEEITFLNWMLWGIPLVILLVIFAWGVLCVGFNTWHTDTAQVHMPFAPEETEHPLQYQAFIIALLYIGMSALLSYLPVALPIFILEILLITLLLTVILTWYLFLYPVINGGPFLTFVDTYRDLPIKGLELLGVLLLLGGAIYLLGIQDWLANQAQFLLPKGMNPFVLLLMAALITTFATEILSNTLVQLAMFVVVLPLSISAGVSPIQALMVVTLACACAFMSPIATPVNALAFGGTQGVSLKQFMIVGAIMNILSSTLIAAYVLTFVNYGIKI